MMNERVNAYLFEEDISDPAYDEAAVVPSLDHRVPLPLQEMGEEQSMGVLKFF